MENICKLYQKNKKHMGRVLLMIILFIAPGFLSAQEGSEMRIVEGTMYDDLGEALPGVNIAIKNSNIGTVTNLEGYYSIEAPLGSILVISSVGYATQQVLVTRDNSRPLYGQDKVVEKKPVPNQLRNFSNLDQQQGVAIMHDSLPRAILKFKNPRMRAFKINHLPAMVASALHGDKGKNGVYVLSQPENKNDITQFSYNTVIELRQASRLPLLQDEFAQGRPDNGELTWQGPHQQEIFSWGPPVNNLEYDGSAYPYHHQGQLVSSGNGNGVPAEVYNPYDFFRNGAYWKNNLGFVLNDYNVALSTNIGQHISRDIISEKGEEKYYGNLLFDYNRYWGRFKLNAAASQQEQWGPQGFNRMKTIGSVYRTPPTFNNEFGYQLPDGSPKSHSPAVVDNPYGMSAYIPDQRTTQQAAVGLSGDFSIESYYAKLFDLSINGHYNYTFDDFQLGMPPNSLMLNNGWLAQRQFENNSYSTNVTVTSTPLQNNFHLQLKLRHQYLVNDSRLHRRDGFDFANEYDITQAEMQGLDTFYLKRESHQASFGTEIKIRKNYQNLIQLIYNQQVYTSNTLTNKEVYWLPAISGKIFLDDILDRIFYFTGKGIGNLDFNAAYSRSVNEAPLIYNRWHFQGLQNPVADYQQILEQNEVLFQPGLLPEVMHKFDLGLSYSNGPVDFDVEYFENTTENFLLPLWQGSDINFANVATVLNPGWNISLQYQFGNYGEFRYVPKLSWQRSRPVVKSATAGVMPMAGFENIFTAIAEGQPLGAIYGTTYQRNAAGEILIGFDGFPLENEVPAYLGNPNPDFILDFSNQVSIGPFKIDWVLEWRHGGSIWNGTQSYLDYLGRSQATADLRETTSHIFPGAMADYTANTQPVSFADPALPLNENRWVRYGADGVGEDYLQEVSWLRLSKLLVGYEFTYPANSAIDHLSINLYANNLFFKSNYEGIAPINNWMDDVAGHGLDFFNYPMLRTFGISTTLKF